MTMTPADEVSTTEEMKLIGGVLDLMASERTVKIMPSGAGAQASRTSPSSIP